MGQEITSAHFNKQDFAQFNKRLTTETELLRQWFADNALSKKSGIGGFELEAWLVDERGAPTPINEEYLQRLGNDALCSPELSRFNVEINSSPLALSGAALHHMQQELESNWAVCQRVASEFDASLLMVGILPTLKESELILDNMSRMERYRALNEQVLRLRQGKPLELDIHGEEHLQTRHADVMLEAATTSFQIHLQVAEDKAVRCYNAMQILAAPMVAISANSPLLFGKRLWQETRIPLFEQAVAVGGIAGGAFGPLRRVSFGSGYARHSVMELFTENAEHFPVLLAEDMGDDAAQLNHLRLHNGTIWRWNRPLIGFDQDGTPHLRIEHRVVPSGPTVLDCMANAAFFFGLVNSLMEQPIPPEQQLEFFQARDNFYAAAHYALDAQVSWLDGWHGRMAELVRYLLPLSHRGLQHLGCHKEIIDRYLGIIERRLHSGQTGAVWQLGYLRERNNDFSALVAAYLERQESGLPVHEWTL